MKNRLWLCTVLSIIFCCFCYLSVHGSPVQRHVSERHALWGNVCEGELMYLQAPPEDPSRVDDDIRQPPEYPYTAGAEDPDEGTDETYYLVLCIENNTTADITYQYRWGGGAWESVVLKGKDRKLHARTWKEKEGGQTYPDFCIKFSPDISGKSPGKESVLKTYVAPKESCTYARIYHFKQKDQRIDLTEG